MRTRSERSYKDLRELDTDPLRLCRRFARAALENPEQEIDDLPETVLDPGMYAGESATDFDPEDAVAFGRVARLLSSLEIEDDPVFAAMRDQALTFLTPKAETFAAPIVDTDEGQIIRFGRGRDGRIKSVTVIRSDGRKVTSSDMRFPFRAASELDAETRISQSAVNRFNLESPDPRVVDRAKDETAYVERLAGDEKYRQAAELYSAAKAAGYPSTRRLIMDKMFVSYNYAGVLVKRAREKGYLPPVDGREEVRREASNGVDDA